MKKVLCLLSIVFALCLCSCEFKNFEFGETDGDLIRNKFSPGFSDYDYDEKYDDVTDTVLLSGTTATSASNKVKINGSIITVDKEGTYIFSGKLANGSIVVNCSKSEKVKLVLKGVDITSKKSAPVNIMSADKVIITLANGTENKLSDTYRVRKREDTSPSACIYSKDDLTINGSGRLVVNGNFNNGIGCKNDLRIMSGTISVNAKKNGIKGKGSVCFNGGRINIVAVKDGVLSDEEGREDKSFIFVQNGNIDIKAGDDGMQAINNVTVYGGTVTVDAKDKTVNSYGSQNIKSDLLIEK